MKKRSKKQDKNINNNDEKLPLYDALQSFPSDEILIELAKNNCMLHKTSDDLGFLVTFDLNDLRQFCTKLLKCYIV